MKKYFIFIFLSLLLALSGCKQQDTGSTGTFIGGTDGVSVRVKVLLKNKGETRVATGNAKARIFGVTLENFGLTQDYKTNLGPIEARGEFTSDGGEQEVELGTIKYKLPVINSEDYTLRARLCYPYQTKALVDVCIKSTLSQESGEEICNIGGEFLEVSQALLYKLHR